MQYHQYQREPQQQPSERNGHSHHSVMDIRNLCQRLDVDSLKAKLSTLPQLKLPKSLPKLRAARRFFHSSHENGSGKAAPGTGTGIGTSTGTGTGTGTDSLAPAMPQAQFINRTPQRISTISSLMHEQAAVDRQVTAATTQQLQSNASTYRSAGSLDDEYYAPYGTGGRGSRPISPIRMPPDTTLTTPTTTTTTTTSSLTQRLQRGYKSLSELRLKHLFAKQTTIRRDGIEVDRYVEQYEAERRLEQLEQARRDREIADNYDIHISTLPMSRQNTMKEEEDQQQQQQQQQQDQHGRSVPEHSGDESGMEEAMPQQQAPPRKKTGIAASRFAKVRQPPLPMPVQEQQEQAEQQRQKEQQPMRQAVRQNLKRLRKSIKRVHHQPARPAAEDTDEDEGQTKTRTSTGGTLRARLRRFASSEQLPQRWRKSFKSNSETQEQSAQQLPGGAAAGTAGASAGATLGLAVGAHLERTMTKLNEKMQQLKFFQRAGDKKSAEQMGNKPNTIGREPVDIDDDELEATYHHSDSASDDSDQEMVTAEVEQERAQQQKERVAASPGLVKRQTLTTLAQLQAHSTTAWSSESLEEDASAEQQLATAASDYPRVLIHQQQTDAYESTLIIAVTATPPSSSPPAPIAAGKQRSTAHQWVSNEQIIADFKAQQATSSVWPAPALYKPKSIDIFEGDVGAAAAFADFDEALRNAPVLRISTGSSCDSGEDADDSSSRVTKIRLQTPQIGNSCESLMEQQPLEDEEEDDDAAEEDDEDDDDDDDDEQALAERPPSVSPPPPPLPQRRPPPSTVAPIYDAVPPPLPISKPPIATAIQTTAAPTATAPLATAALAAAAMPLGLAKLPQRSVSMTRPSKPLVKTSSLRLTYREQMHPGDVGKVNKLISRFEGRPRLCARRLHSEELTMCSDADDEPDQEPDKNIKKEKEMAEQQLPPTPTPANVKRNVIPDIVTTQAISNNNNNNNQNHNNNNNNNNISGHTSSRDEAQLQLSLDRQNSNCSRSEYGSPLAYPLSNSRRRSSTPTMATALNTSSSLHAFTPQSQSQSQLLQQQQQQQRAQARRSRRSLTRDDDNFYSFDSDEENSYYSISPSSSSRYVVEI
ncbi:protein PIP82 [Drosophila virilis]|uniref:Uncharacterized protein n=1 Tax=Drosophila virilis TaxID=7244 RepID=B4M1N0_DROVI|nr:actin cytoskeleton-regulatory complex protein PAN1 [Drosophila virilis]EDW65584.1 uncharacterized protein Dvir_GJ19338 [Drosophila virilis]